MRIAVVLLLITALAGCTVQEENGPEGGAVAWDGPRPRGAPGRSPRPRRPTRP